MVGFIVQLMLHAGPHIHANGPELDFHRQAHPALGDHERHIHHQVQRPVAVGLGVFDIVPLLEQLIAGIPDQQSPEIINIVNIVADNPDACQVLEAAEIFRRHLKLLALQLFDDAGQRFQPALQMMNGRVVVFGGKLLVENIQLGDSHLHGAGVNMSDTGVLLVKFGLFTVCEF